ncbi:MAG: glutamine amidotransferase family protein [Chloroflexi bacterium]|jgi:glutamate synthase domain-containing protein 1|nr:glutamine amidotransferase family protein [Chloroflexota bacterium]MBT7080258.1 glutamine amidotransferase family protein [Chloroflexota bacterium]MBT7289338.1 glutamine amidotransferase family protein [Chloroflexota bacterium]
MRDLGHIQNPYSDGKVIDSCSIFGMMDTSGKRFSGEGIIRAIGNMHFRGNGLGGGFAVYGLYPEHPDDYAFHIMYNSDAAKIETEEYLNHRFDINLAEVVPTKLNEAIINPPLVIRYFASIKPEIAHAHCVNQSQDDYVVSRVMEINTHIADSFVFSSGKNMAVFKGVGYPEEIAEYFQLAQYEGYLWTAHGRFPTNTRGWWGGAHPFSIHDWTVVHNGEISSYGTNKRFLEEYGYECTMQTDTEVVAYAVDLLARRHNLPVEIIAKVFSPPFWHAINRRSPEQQEMLGTLRQVYSGLLLNGPFTIILAHQGEMIGLTDRIRLRPLTVGVKGSTLYLSSEESAIRLICPDLDKAWIPMGGEPIIGSLKSPIIPGSYNQNSAAAGSQGI